MLMSFQRLSKAACSNPRILGPVASGGPVNIHTAFLRLADYSCFDPVTKGSMAPAAEVAGIVSFTTMNDAMVGADVSVKHIAGAVELLEELQRSQEVAGKPAKKESEADETAKAVALRISGVQRRVCDSIANQYHQPGAAFHAAAEDFLRVHDAEAAKKLKSAAQDLKRGLNDATEELEKMGDALAGRGYMHILRNARFTEQERTAMWSKIKGAAAYSTGVILVIIGIAVTLDAVCGGGLFTLVGAAVGGAIAIWGGSSVAAAAAFMAANRMLAEGKKSVLDQIVQVRNGDGKLMTATSRTTDAVVTMLAVLQRTHQFADDVIAACSTPELNIFGIGAVIAPSRSAPTEVCPTKLSGNTLTTLLTTQGKLQQYAPLADDDVPDPSDFVALFNPICKLPEEAIGKGTKGASHISVLSRYQGSLKISMADVFNRKEGPQYVAYNSTFVAGCDAAHVWITIVDEEVKPPKEYRWRKFAGTGKDYVVIKRSSDGELHLVNRATLPKFL